MSFSGSMECTVRFKLGRVGTGASLSVTYSSDENEIGDAGRTRLLITGRVKTPVVNALHNRQAQNYCCIGTCHLYSTKCLPLTI